MGDRFYLSQLAATGSCPGYKGSSPKKRSGSAPVLKKADVVASIPIKSKGISKLTLADLLMLSSIDFSTKFSIEEQPTGKLKRPYVSTLVELLGDMGFSKMTIAELQELINEITE